MKSFGLKRIFLFFFSIFYNEMILTQVISIETYLKLQDFFKNLVLFKLVS